MIKIIGQIELKKTISAMAVSGFPRCTLLVGIKGSGTTLMSQYIADRIEAEWILVDSKVANIREAITLAQKRSTPTVYVFADVQDMSGAAKNSMLKMAEEPPENAYVVLTTTNQSEVLDTLVSRSYVLQMQDYWNSELIQYATERQYPIGDLKPEVLAFVTQAARVPGEIDQLFTYNVEEFMTFMHKVVNNLPTVSGVNALKIQNYLSLKADATGYDLTLFLRAYLELCGEVLVKRPIWFKDENYRLERFVTRYNMAMAYTTKYLQELTSISGVNQLATFDMWVLDVRKQLVP